MKVLLELLLSLVKYVSLGSEMFKNITPQSRSEESVFKQTTIVTVLKARGGSNYDLGCKGRT